MKHLNLDAPSLTNYSGLLQRLCPEAVGFAVHGADGNWIATSAAVEADARAALGNLTPQEYAEAGRMGRFDLDNGHCLYTMDLSVASDDSLGTLVVEVDARSATDRPASEADTYSALVPFLVCVITELRLNTELDDMASELTVRYEELNLVYHTEDQVSLFDEGQNALKKLVDNCADYLDVRVAILCMREKGVFVVSDANNAFIDVELLERPIKETIYHRVEAGGEPLAINEPDEKNGQWAGGLPCKLLACPVLDSTGLVDGVLFMMNEVARPDFTNSDKNLLAVMARKVTKIVQGSYDNLTGLINRKSFEHLVSQNLTSVHETENTHCVLHGNIDRLHVVNDTAGNEAGDEILKKIGALLSGSIRDSDILARIGGDEFGILSLNCSMEQGEKIAEKLRQLINDTAFSNEEDSANISIRFGVATISALTGDTQEALTAAHLACDAARDQGGNRVQTYGHDDEALAEREQQMKLVGRLHSALREDRFELYSQLIAPLSAPNHRHSEILIRMIGNDGSPISPGMFLPAAERYQLMPDVDRWVVRRAFEMLAEGMTVAEMADTVIAINLSGQSLSADGFPEFVESVLDEFSIPGELICFEITETAAMANMSQARAFMNVLKERGCSFSLDDFGAGLSSFAYLQTFPVDYLKIDGALVKGIVDDPVAESMVAAINQVGHVMGIQTIAEFVENASIKDRLRVIGVDYVQGYGIQKPQPLTQQLHDWREQKLATAV